MRSFRTDVATISVVLLAAVVAGCNGKSPAKTDGQKTTKTGDDTQKKQPDDRKPAAKLKPFDPPTSVTLVDVTPMELQAKIADYKGHVVLVDYWFVNCLPCREAFPHTVALSRKHAKDGLVVVTMCVEEDYRQRGDSLEFLKSKNARLVNFFTSDKLDPAKLEEFGVLVFPTYRVYGPDGKLAETVIAETPDFQDRVDAAVMKALGLN